MDTTRRFSCAHDVRCIVWNTSLVLPHGSHCTKCLDFVQGWEEACWSTFTHGFGKLVFRVVFHFNCRIRFLIVHSFAEQLGVVGGIIELLTRLIAVGMNNAQEWLAKDFNLSDWGSEGESSGDGWRVLEMIHIVTRGMLLWIDSFEALAIFGIVVIIWYSVGLEPKFKSVKRSLSVDTGVVASSPESENAIIIEDEAEESLDDDSQEVPTTQQPPSSAFAAVSATTKVAVKPTFTKCFTYYGLFVGFLSAIDFVAAVLRFINWPLFGRIAMVTQTLVGVIFLPIWLLIFAKQLGRATDSFEREEQRRVHLDGCTDDEVTGLLA